MKWPETPILRLGRASLILLASLVPASLRAQSGEHVHGQPAVRETTMSGHEHMHMAPSAGDTSVQGRPRRSPGRQTHAGMAGMTGHAHMAMPAMYGPYRFTREASGTAWQPESAPHRGWHVMRGDWSLMLHGFASVLADRQGGPRGDDQIFSTNMFMAMASRPLGAGRLGLRGMASLEPLSVGRRGYPLLLQTGETADGRTHLVDRQHPHDLFMELAAAWSVSDATRAAFIYVGLPGEPALGPPAFMHRASGDLNPESPIGHHWLDSTHITYGVATLGAVQGGIKLEASGFRGREPDQHRFDLETPKLDSYSSRLSWNPTPGWAFQASAGHLHSPEQLTPALDTDRATLSAMWSRQTAGRRLSAMAAWGRNWNRPGRTLDAGLLEGAAELGERHTVFARLEQVEKDELFPEGDARAEEAFTVGRLSAGYVRQVFGPRHVTVGVGGMGSISIVPEELKGVYGDTPLSASLFARAQLR